MNALTRTLVAAGLLAAAGAAGAAETLQSSRSAGKLVADGSVDLAQELKQREPLTRTAPATSEDYVSAGKGATLDGIANRHDQLFEIYSANVRRVADLDFDGYHHALDVSFDVDVSHDGATVYAKLYLSRDGGPWSQYFTTDLFEIHGNEAADAYEVRTELLDGYPPGYYDVLIEIYSLDHAYMVASLVLDYHYLGRDLALEDLGWDEPYEEVYVEEVYGEVSVSGGGDFAALALFLVFIQIAIAARGVLASTPCKTATKQLKE